MNFSLILLSNAYLKSDLLNIANKKKFIEEIIFVEEHSQIQSTLKKETLNKTVLIAFGTGVIVSEEILDRLGNKNVFNIHAASRFFPGRDPHHFAAYEKVEQFGATAHYMRPSVDSGEIVAESLIKVGPNLKPVELQELAEKEGKNLFDRLLENISVGRVTTLDVRWKGKKTSRSDFLELSEICPSMTDAEISRRAHAVEHPDHQNLNVWLGEKSYTISPKKFAENGRHSRWSYFTEEGYKKLIETTLSCGYKFESFGTNSVAKHVLWRHDIDGSMLRARKIGEIEASFGVCSTFFIFLRSNTYNPLDKSNLDIIKFLADNGHHLGLHFDAGYYGYNLEPTQLEKFINFERNVLEESTAIPLQAISFHDPDAGNMLKHSGRKIGGLINAYSEYLREEYEYCSDSNGYWRHQPIPDVIRKGCHEKIQVLTHPMWWAKQPLPPRKRVTKMLLENMQNILQEYDNHLEAAGRKNIKR